MEYLDKSIGKTVFMNVFTRERFEKIEFYDGEGVKRARDLHVYQSEVSMTYPIYVSTMYVCMYVCMRPSI